MKTNDCLPFYCVEKKSGRNVAPVTHPDCQKHTPGELVMCIYYAVPILKAGRTSAMCQEFELCEFRTCDLDYGIQFYQQKLDSYRARLDTQYAQMLNERRMLFNDLTQICQRG